MTDAERRKRVRLRAAAAEAACAEYLRRKGYTVLDKNYFCRGGELDLVAELNTGGLLSKRLASLRRGYTVFVEVKYRSTDYAGRPLEAVTERKKERIRRAAAIWLVQNEERALQPRFDVMEVTDAPGGGFLINHIENAFE